MNREIFTPVIDESLDIQYTALSEIHGFKKEKMMQAILTEWMGRMTESTSMQQLAEYASAKKMDAESQQWAREELVRKVVSGKC